MKHGTCSFERRGQHARQHQAVILNAAIFVKCSISAEEGENHDLTISKTSSLETVSMVVFNPGPRAAAVSGGGSGDLAGARCKQI